jgi:hypothetical protein
VLKKGFHKSCGVITSIQDVFAFSRTTNAATSLIKSCFVAPSENASIYFPSVVVVRIGIAD